MQLCDCISRTRLATRLWILIGEERFRNTHVCATARASISNLIWRFTSVPFYSDEVARWKGLGLLIDSAAGLQQSGIHLLIPISKAWPVVILVLRKRLFFAVIGRHCKIEDAMTNLCWTSVKKRRCCLLIGAAHID